METVERRRGGAVAVALRTKVELWVLVTLAATAFVIGLALGLSAVSRDQPSVPIPERQRIPAAPPLTAEELGGGLPQDHPSIGPTSGGPGGAAGPGT